MTDVLASADPGSPGAPTDPASEPTQGVGTAVLEREELQSTDDGDADRFAHYVRKDKIAAAAVTGRPVVALCGKVWTPGRDPSKYPVCPTCKSIYEEMRNGEGSGDGRSNGNQGRAMSQQRAPPVMPASLGTTTTSSPILASWAAVIRRELPPPR